MQLVAYLGQDKESWGQITALMNRMECDKILLVKDKTINFPASSKCKSIHIDPNSSLTSLTSDIKNQLKTHLNSELEVALSIASGTGKEHMAIISALLNIPVGIKLVAYTKNGIEFLT